uniref:RRAD, Ras related glycolysis inhibitor and calcium channel regulator n=1 Tax=Anolis carolinensis TaxID=28377 RepID=H9G679_ANOCA
MTLNRSARLSVLDWRRGSTPFAAQQLQHQAALHRRSMPVDERELRAAPEEEEAAAEEGRRQASGSSGSLASSSASSSGSDAEGRLHKVLLLGARGVGKSSLARVFGGLEEGPEAEEAGNTYDRSIVVDGEEASLVVFDIWEQDDSQWLQNHCMKMGDAYIIVYSVTDKVSFEKASELRIQLRRARQTEDIPIILVGNKSDLVRSREVSVDEGRACAVVFDCKFIETSALCITMSRTCLKGLSGKSGYAKTAKKTMLDGCPTRKEGKASAKRPSGSWGELLQRTIRKWHLRPSPSPATTCQCFKNSFCFLDQMLCMWVVNVPDC